MEDIVQTITKTISNQVTIEISTNDIFNWFTNCRDIETLKYLGKYALAKASYMENPDNDDFRSRI
ncbi:hypothetical protein [Intestinibacter sp.]|uniref:hypothetical protein n=1 Tax=Intestinibacter sp. TaxID=1965304 RepID=UPI002A91C435|nr:hypothetical protein [Intestinibacter sp.]MDY5211685.1 hypothetical protein [Intestinibacter sp.]